MIIAADFLERQKKMLLEMLRRNIKAIGWIIPDIPEIPPSICYHIIWLNSDCKPSVSHQMRLNPPMRDVVKKEMI